MVNKVEPDEWWFKIRHTIGHSQFKISPEKAKHFQLNPEPFETAFLFADFKRQRLTTFRRAPF